MTKENVLVRCSEDICNKVNKAYIEVMTHKPRYLDTLLTTVTQLRKRIDYTYQDLATLNKLPLSTFKYHLKMINLTVEEIKEALLKEKEALLKESINRKEHKHMLPSNYEDFLSRSVVQEVKKKLMSADISQEQRNRILRLWFRLCIETGLAPEDFYEDIKSKISDWLANKIQQGYEKRSLISNLQGLAKWLEAPLLSSAIEQAEYKGEFTRAEIPLSVREKIVNDLINLYKETQNEFYKRALACYVFLYYTASRSEALLNFEIEERAHYDIEDFRTSGLGEDFLVVITHEKGKKGKKLTWEKIIPLKYEKLIRSIVMSKRDIVKLRKLTKELLLKYINELNEDTKRYILEADKSLHLWRHTSARDYLRAFRYNRYLVSKLGGWVKESNLSIYGDFTTRELLANLSRGKATYKVKFIENEELEKEMLDLF